MDLQELKERYKMLPMWVRLLGMFLIGLSPGIYIYFDEGELLMMELEEVQSEEAVARQKFESARQKKANLPKLEEKKAFTEEQLVKARSKLPDEYKIDEVLQKTATIAKEVGVEMRVFDPQEDKIKGQADFKYKELPVATEIEGKFAQVALFLDRVVHLDINIFIRDLDFAAVLHDPKRPDGVVTVREAAKENRKKLRVLAKFNMVVFRGLSDRELASEGAGNGVEDTGGFEEVLDKEDDVALNDRSQGLEVVTKKVESRRFRR